MLELIRQWVLGLTGTALVCAVATELTPKGPVKGVVRTVCALALTAALLSPLLSLDYPAYALNLAKYRAGAEALTGEGAARGEELNRRVIEEKLRAYILDKAAALGAKVTDARVTLKWSGEGCWYPVAAELTGTYHPGVSDALASELGIPKEAQTWNAED